MMSCYTTFPLTHEIISFWGYKEQESNLILPEHDDDDDDDDVVLHNFSINTRNNS